MRKNILILILAVLIGLALVAVGTSASKAAPTTGTTVSQQVTPVTKMAAKPKRANCKTPANEHRKQKRPHIYHRTSLWTDQCIQMQPGADKMWIRPRNWLALYNRENSTPADIVFFCGFIGEFKGVTYRLYIYNPDTGFNWSKKGRTRCDMDTVDSVVKSLSDAPRCYMPIVDTGGRAPGGRRSHCKFKVTYHEHWSHGYPDHYGNVGSGYINP